MVKLKYNLKIKEYYELPKHSKEGIYLDGFLWNTLKNAKQVMKIKDVDLPIVISGYPGVGKSTFVSQLATICDPTFTEERMYQNAEDFIEGVKSSNNPGEAHVLDESYKDLNSSDIRKEVGRALMNVLNIIRQKRLYIFILLPNFFDLGKNIACFRTRWLIHCYEKAFGDIGFWVAFDRSKKRQLYIQGKRFEDYECVRADARGIFTKKVPDSFNWGGYEKMKDAGLQDVFVKKESDKNSIKQRDKMILHFNQEHDYSTKKICDLFEMNIRNIQDIISKQKKLI